MKHNLTMQVKSDILLLQPISNNSLISSQASHTIERDEIDLPTGALPPVAGAHAHDGKKIGNGFPNGGYGTRLLSHRKTHVTDIYCPYKMTSTSFRNLSHHQSVSTSLKSKEPSPSPLWICSKPFYLLLSRQEVW